MIEREGGLKRAAVHRTYEGEVEHIGKERRLSPFVAAARIALSKRGCDEMSLGRQ